MKQKRRHTRKTKNPPQTPEQIAAQINALAGLYNVKPKENSQ